MPGHRVHDGIALATAPLLAAGTYAVSDISTAGVLAGSYLVASFWLSPDLDIDSAPLRRWGPLRVVWLPYTWAVPHRSILSHSGVSALLRLAYLGAAIALIAALFGLVLPIDPLRAIWDSHRTTIYLIAAGAVLSDVVHVAADLVVSTAKKLYVTGVVVGALAALVLLWLV
jgi:uncharacterized metal-binding protein